MSLIPRFAFLDRGSEGTGTLMHRGSKEPVRMPRGAHIYKGLASLPYKCSRNCQ